MAKLYDVVAATGRYTNAAGEEKTRWLKCGAVVEGKHGPSLILDAVPIARNDNGELWFQLFERSDNEGGSAPSQSQSDAPF